MDADATAFAHRDARVLMAIFTFLEGDEGVARIRDAYPAATYARLAAVRSVYDPHNVVHRNQNIRPAS